MTRLLCWVVLAISAIVVYYLFLKSPPPLPKLDLEEWWGPQELKGRQDTSIKPFKVHFDNELIQGLRQRLKNTRLPQPPLEGVNHEYGFNIREIGDWLKYWTEEYDFGERQNFLNQYQQYRTNIQGLGIHFVRVKPKVPPGVEIVPMLLLHGWPGSVREFYEAIPHLTAVEEGRNFAIEVIIPNLPGFGYSDAAVRPGLSPIEMAVVFKNLMQRLGFKQYYVQGGDWGSIIARSMAILFPEEVLGLHSNFGMEISATSLFLRFVGSLFPSLYVGADVADREYPLSKYLTFLLEESGYFHLQATKPDTIGVALSDSPAGLLAYFLEKYPTATDRNQRPFSDHFTKEQFIDNVMFYYATNKITSSFRIYAEAVKNLSHVYKFYNYPTSVPAWVLQAKYELTYQPPFILRQTYRNLVNTTNLDEGGHFLVFQLPEILAADVVKAVTEFRKLKGEGISKSEL